MVEATPTKEALDDLLLLIKTRKKSFNITQQCSRCGTPVTVTFSVNVNKKGDDYSVEVRET